MIEPGNTHTLHCTDVAGNVSKLCCNNEIMQMLRYQYRGEICEEIIKGYYHDPQDF
jgi:hypothetical protein